MWLAQPYGWTFCGGRESAPNRNEHLPVRSESGSHQGNPG
jgi:hypothetical protein